MANAVRIEIETTTQKAERGFEGLKKQMKGIREEAGRTDLGMRGVGSSFGGFVKRAASVVGIGLSVAFAFKQITEGMEKTARTAGFTETVLSGFGPDFTANLRRVEGSFDQLRSDFAFTALEAKNAFAIITRESRTATVGTQEVAAAMALARITGMNLTATATVMGQAFLGNVEPLRKIVGEVSSYEEFLGRLIPAGKKATTALAELGAVGREAVEDVGEDLNEFLADPIGFLIKQFTPQELNPLEQALRDKIAGAFKSAWDTFLGSGDFTIDISIKIGKKLADWFWKVVNFVTSWGNKDSKTTISFKTKILPKWFWTVVDFVEEKIWPVTVVFFTKILPDWFWAVVRFLDTRVWQPVITFITKILPAWFWLARDFLKTKVWNPVIKFVTEILPAWFWLARDFLKTNAWEPSIKFATSVLPDWFWDVVAFVRKAVHTVTINFRVGQIPKLPAFISNLPIPNIPFFGGSSRAPRDFDDDDSPSRRSGGGLTASQKSSIASAIDRGASERELSEAGLSESDLHEGGLVQGPVGRAFAAIVHGGERVLTPAQVKSGGGGMGGDMHFHFGNVQIQNESQLYELAQQIKLLIQQDNRRGIGF